MNSRQEFISGNVDRNRQEILDAERWIWQHPQTGYTEWEAHEYLVKKFQSLGYTLVRADEDPRYGKIPGFYTDLYTGSPGPCICIVGELDALDNGNHPEAVNGIAHCCGHNVQAAGVLGVAEALKEPGALDGLCGTIRLMLVPAEELIQLQFREELIQRGIISYKGGKIEFMHRGYFDGVDITIMVHTACNSVGADFYCVSGSNGILAKDIEYLGKSAHAGVAPHEGVNAQYAATLGLQACNDLRETLRENDQIRFHPIIKGVKSSVNVIPDSMAIESYVRGKSLEAMMRENIKFNRALAGGALAMGARLVIKDRHGYSPERHDEKLMRLTEQCCADLVGCEKVKFEYDVWGTGSSDIGDVSTVMPIIQFQASGAEGSLHGSDFTIADPEKACINSVKAQLFVVDSLLQNQAYAAAEIINEYDPQFSSIKDYFHFIDALSEDRNVVEYDEQGNASIHLTD